MSTDDNGLLTFKSVAGFSSNIIGCERKPEPRSDKMHYTLGDSINLARKAMQIRRLSTVVKLPSSRPFTDFSRLKVDQCTESGMPDTSHIRDKLCRSRLEVGAYHKTCLSRTTSVNVNKLTAASCCVSYLTKRRLISTSQNTQNCTILRARSDSQPILQSQCACFPVRHYSRGKETVEKRLLQLMDMWEVEEAVALLRESVGDNVIPHANVVLNLQQQLANLGEEHNLSSDTRFFHFLQEAYYNSGRISEGVSVLRLLYHRTREFADVEVYFTLLTVMVMRHFPDRLDLILSFVTDLKDAEIPVLEPEASLWKCYMMTGQWSQADELLLGNEELQPLIPRQVARICQSVDQVQMDHVAVLTQLLNLPFIRQKLRVFVAETLIAQLVREKQWPKLLKTLKKLKSLNLPLHSDKLSPALDDLRRHLTPQYDDQLQEMRLWCDSLQGKGQE
ncbi:uncharacterized protein LOC143285789 isoform X2 [Babylonia areolata]|uniref:uncharacterized protein LOC143285789 isoform X2 n=1 Tax=Babylonia areolata TaxID=304850 RepID=UPI003FD50731